jgi:hypothetical protein
MFVGLLVVVVLIVSMVEAEERDKRAPILGLLLAKKLLHGGGKNIQSTELCEYNKYLM